MKALRFGQRLWSAMTAAVLLALLSLPANAQCAMCRVAVEGGSSAKMARSLNLGIIVLLIPPVTIFCAIFITVYKRGKWPKNLSRNI